MRKRVAVSQKKLCNTLCHPTTTSWRGKWPESACSMEVRRTGNTGKRIRLLTQNGISTPFKHYNIAWSGPSRDILWILVKKNF